MRLCGHTGSPPENFRNNMDSIRIILSLNDQYAREVTTRAAQLTESETPTFMMEGIRPVCIELFVDPEFL